MKMYIKETGYEE